MLFYVVPFCNLSTFSVYAISCYCHITHPIFVLSRVNVGSLDINDECVVCLQQNVIESPSENCRVFECCV